MTSGCDIRAWSWFNGFAVNLEEVFLDMIRELYQAARPEAVQKRKGFGACNVASAGIDDVRSQSPNADPFQRLPG